MVPFPLAPDEKVLEVETCAPVRRTVVMARLAAVGAVLAIAAFALGLALRDEARVAAFIVSAVVVVTAITLGWFAFIRFLEDPRLRVVTTTRVVEIARSGELRTTRRARSLSGSAV